MPDGLGHPYHNRLAIVTFVFPFPAAAVSAPEIVPVHVRANPAAQASARFLVKAEVNPSGHASLSSAARSVLERVFGNRRQSITLSSPALPGVVLHYNRFREITDDIDDARVYGGTVTLTQCRKVPPPGGQLGVSCHWPGFDERGI
jgi:hypothetical protein